MASPSTRILEFYPGLYLAFGVAVDDDEGQVAALSIAGCGDIEQIEWSQVCDPVWPGGGFRGQVMRLALHVGVEHDLVHVFGAEPEDGRWSGGTGRLRS